MIGRRGSAADLDRVRSVIQTVHLARLNQPQDESRVVMLPVTGRQNESAGPALLLLAISVGSILLIGIANAAGLVFTRSLFRGHEIAVRASLGASRGRIVGQLLTESSVVASLAAIAGILVAYWVLEVLRTQIPPTVTRQIVGWEQQLGMDAKVAGFAILLAVLSGLVCGLAPAIGATRRNLNATIGQGANWATISTGKSRLLTIVVASEVALSLALLLFAGLLGKNLIELSAVEPGFETATVLSLSWIIPEPLPSGPADILRQQDGLVETAIGIPGIRRAAISSDLPVSGSGFATTRNYLISGSDPGGPGGQAAWRSISPEYVRALGIALIEGRELADADGPETPRVALVSETLARRHWGSGSPLGDEIFMSDQSWRVVGVVRDVHTFRPWEPVQPTVYVPQAQFPTERGFLLSSFSGESPARLSQTVRQELWATQPGVALGEPRTLDGVISDLFARERILTVLVVAFAGTALLITLASVYAVVGHSVLRRRREYGIRMAFGAGRRDVLRRAIWDVMKTALAGTLGGIVLAAGIAQLISSLIYGIQPLEPAVFLILPLLLVALLAVAAYVPARQASRLDPVVVLRS